MSLPCLQIPRLFSRPSLEAKHFPFNSLYYLSSGWPGLDYEKCEEPMKTTRTAQYAALAANNSCLLAFVSNVIVAAKRSVKIIKTPMAAKTALLVFMVDSRYMPKTGAASKIKITDVIIKFTSLETREGEK